MLANRTLQASSNNTGYQIPKSLRFRSAASAYLTKTFTTVGTRTTWTFSAWVKVSSFGTQRRIFTDTSGNSYIRFNTANQLDFNFWTGSVSYTSSTAAVYRDPSAWYHIVVSVDTTQATAANRVKIYVNGTQITTWASGPTYPTQNAVSQINNNTAHYISSLGGSSEFFDGYMAEYHFVDGQALDPTSFGQTEPVSGVWSAKRYSGTYGTNGFYLDFSNTTSLTTLGYDKSRLSRIFSTASTHTTTAATHSFTVPTYSSNIVVTMWGGGGGGGGGGSTFGNNASSGTASTFLALSAGGGAGGTGAWTANPTGSSGAGGTASGGDINTNGNSIATSNGATTGAGAPNGGGNTTTATGNAEHYNGTVPGGGATGGRWAGSGNPTGGAGGSGAYVQKTYAVGALTPGAVITVTVGGGGAGGASDADQGATGAAGRVTVAVDGVSSGNDWTPANFNLDTIPRTFTTVGTTSWVAPAGVTSVQYLVVAGGGGGANWGGGGGAGGFRTGTLSVTPGNSYTVIVGAGGTGGLSGGSPYDGNNGSDSVFDTITSTGGGGGTYNGPGKNGGSGGGAAFTTGGGAGGLGNTPSTSPSQGNNGGAGSASAPYQAGGGGAGAVGGNGGGGSSGAGGAGVASSITGVSVTYAGGGGGGGGLNAGGNWGGGAGGTGGGGAGSQSSTGANGTANTGGGGGGSGRSTNTFFDAGNGGSGVVILSPSGSTTTYDSMLDVPFGTGVGERGNYATLNPLQRILVGTLSGGNLDAASASNNMFRVATLDLQRDTYYECLNTANTRVGLVWLPIQDDGSNWFAASTAYVLLNSGGALTTQNCSASQSATPSYSTGNTLGLAWNATARTLTLYVNNVLSTVVTVTSPTAYPHPLFANISSGVATSFSVNVFSRILRPLDSCHSIQVIFQYQPFENQYSILTQRCIQVMVALKV